MSGTCTGSAARSLNRSSRRTKSPNLTLEPSIVMGSDEEVGRVLMLCNRFTSEFSQAVIVKVLASSEAREIRRKGWILTQGKMAGYDY